MSYYHIIWLFMETSILNFTIILNKIKKYGNYYVLKILSKLGPLAKLDKALGYEPGDSRFEFWAVHQKGNKNV